MQLDYQKKRLRALPEYISVISGKKCAKIKIDEIEIIEQDGRKLHVITPGRDPTKRRAQDATVLSGRHDVNFASISGGIFASIPPRIGSITMIGIFLSARMSYSSCERTTGLLLSR